MIFKLLYGHDLIIINIPLGDLHKLLELWKSEIEAKELRVHITKTKVMILDRKLSSIKVFHMTHIRRDRYKFQNWLLKICKCKILKCVIRSEITFLNEYFGKLYDIEIPQQNILIQLHQKQNIHSKLCSCINQKS